MKKVICIVLLGYLASVVAFFLSVIATPDFSFGQTSSAGWVRVFLGQPLNNLPIWIVAVVALRFTLSKRDS